MALEHLQSLENRTLPTPLFDNIWIWSVYSQEKGLQFNGYAIKTFNDFILIDPPSASEDIFNALETIAVPSAVLLTNGDHAREAQAYWDRFKAYIYIHDADADMLTERAQKTFESDDILPGGLEVIHLENQKSPGECAFYLPSQNVLFIGDALIGKPAGQLSQLPAEKYANPEAAHQTLKQKLGHLKPEALLLGDGEPVLQSAQQVLSDYLSRD